MRTNRLARARQRLMADPAFAADVARENVVMAELDLARARRTTGMSGREADAFLPSTRYLNAAHLILAAITMGAPARWPGHRLHLGRLMP